MIGLSLLSSVSKHTMWSYYDCIYCCFRSSVSTICGRIMIGLSLLSSVHILYLLTEDIDNPIIIRPHIMFTDGQQQRHPNHNTTTYCVYWRKTTTTQCCCLPSVNATCGDIMIGLSLSSISEHNMWLCYDWVVVVVFRLLTQYVVILWLGCRCCRLSVSTICGPQW
jgi:hypothetical protein